MVTAQTLNVVVERKVTFSRSETLSGWVGKENERRRRMGEVSAGERREEGGGGGEKGWTLIFF